MNHGTHVRKEKRQKTQPSDHITFAIPSITDEQTFAQVQQRMKLNQAKSRLNVQGPKRYLLNGKLFRCLCSLGMVGTTIKGTRYCRCSGVNNILDRTRRCRITVRADDVERRIWMFAEHLYADPSTVLAYTDAQRDKDAAERERVQTDAQQAIWRRDAVEQHAEEVAELRRAFIQEKLSTFSLEEKQRAIAAIGSCITARADLSQKIAVELPIPISSLAIPPTYWD